LVFLNTTLSKKAPSHTVALLVLCRLSDANFTVCQWWYCKSFKRRSWGVFLCCFLVVLEIKLRALHMLGKNSTTELHSQSLWVLYKPCSPLCQSSL
jgi:hypothetical protein